MTSLSRIIFLTSVYQLTATSTTINVFQNVYFLPVWYNGVYKSQRIFNPSLVFCATICRSEIGGKCSFYFLNSDICYLGNLMSNNTGIAIAQNLIPTHILLNKKYLKQEFISKTINNVTFYNWINRKIEVNSAEECQSFCSASSFTPTFCDIYFYEEHICYLGNQFEANHKYRLNYDQIDVQVLGWTLLSLQNKDIWFNYGEWSADSPGKFSMIDQIETYRSCAGHFHFKLVYPELTGFNEWTQTSNPVLQNIVTGYKGINISYPTGFIGMKRDDNNNALIIAEITPGWWFYPVGVISKKFKPYFPGPRGFFNISEIRFYVKKDC